MWLPKGSYGITTARIKNYAEHLQPCKNCRAFDMKIEVFQDYYHFLFIPFAPQPGKTARLRCNSCGEPILTRTILQEYESKTKTPFYLYCGIILIGIFILLLVILNLKTQEEKVKFVESPRIGDVYIIREEENDKVSYYFLRVKIIKADTVSVYHSNLIYNSYTSTLNESDFFVKEETLFFTKKELKKMLADGEINAVERDYGDYEGFNRFK